MADYVRFTVLSNLKRRSRSRSKPEFTSPSKAKPLDILPGVTEEEEERRSISSARSASPYQPPTPCARRSLGGIATVGWHRPQDISERKRDSRRVVLTGAEGLNIDDFFTLYDEPPRPAPSPPCAKPVVAQPQIPARPLSDFSSKSIVCDGPLDDLDFKFSGLGIELDFPSPPSTSRRSHSPTPSCSSGRTTSTTSSSSSTFSKQQALVTPPTSDDESHQPKPHILRAPTHRSQRASILFMKSMSDFQPPVSPHQTEEEPEDISDAEDASWFAQDISDSFTLSTPLPPTTPMTSTSNTDIRARPDSIPPPPRMRAAGHSRFSKPLPVVPRLSIQTLSTRGPSVQLDPTFPAAPRKRHHIPTRPPPPPPIRIDCPSPTMEEKTEELLALLANAALDSGFLGTGLSGSLSALPPSLPVSPSSTFIPDTPARAPPRTSLPADIDDQFDDSVEVGDSEPLTAGQGSFEIELDCLPSPSWPATPKSASFYSQASLSGDALPSSPFEFQFEVETDEDALLSPAMPESPLVGMYASNAPERVLRSRWSCSTLSSMVDTHQIPHSASSWMLRFNLGSVSPSKKGKGKAKSSTRPSLKLGLKSPGSPSFKRSADLDRRDSRSSRMSDCGSDSGDSTTSSGLRRKPIPLEIFLRN